MRITKYLNTTEAEIVAKKFNILIGISLGNKYFTPAHIKAYLAWAIEQTGKVAILIPDKIHAVNYQVKNNYSQERAATVARRNGDVMRDALIELAQESSAPVGMVNILRWEEIEDEKYISMQSVIRKSFEKDSAFRDVVLAVVKEVPHFESLGLNNDQHKQLAQYVLDELPMLISGVRHKGVHYELLPYPGFANIDYFAIDLQEGRSFPEITKELKVSDKLRLIEAYAE